MKYKETFETPTFKGHPIMERYEFQRTFDIDWNVDMSSMSIEYRLQAKIVDMMEEAIVSAIVEEAQRQGVDTLFLINKEFIMSAIWHEIQRLKGEQT